MTPDDPEDAVHLATHRGQGTGGTGLDQLGTVEDADGEDADPDADTT